MIKFSVFEMAEIYEQACIESLLKIAVIKKLPNGKYRVESRKGKNLGTYPTEDKAKNRLRQVEFFKHLDKNNALDSQQDTIDLIDLEELSYSALLRKLNKNATKEAVLKFMEIYKKQFDRAVKEKLQKPESVSMQNSLIAFNKIYKIKLNKDLVKNAAVPELGDPRLVGKYLADIIKFTISRIKPESRPKALASLKSKLYGLNELELSNKVLPASSSMGQSITFVKHVLFSQNAKYIRNVLNNIVRNL